MSTVKEFKGLGGVVIRGDVLHQNNKPDGCVFDDCTIESFAWRINKGITPQF